jgi:3-phenylpropionate/cinnamic acid dioxygenase small subunit
MSAQEALSDAPDCDLSSPQRVRASDPLYWELHEFLEDEAALLDEERLSEWLELFAEDVRYRMPVRVGVNRAMGDGFSRRMCFYNDTRKVLALRIQRLTGTMNGWVEDPPSRIARFVTGIRVFRTPVQGEYAVDSNLLLTRSRSDQGEVKLLTARRRDVLRRFDERVLIARRDIYLNQTTIDMHNLAIFL